MHITLLGRPSEAINSTDQVRSRPFVAANDTDAVPRIGTSSGPHQLLAPFDGNDLRETLKAFGRTDLAASFYADIPADHLFLLACLLRVAANVIEQCDERDRKALLEGRTPRGTLNPASHRYAPWPDLPIDASVVLIRKASEWLDELRELGCSVHIRRRRQN